MKSSQRKTSAPRRSGMAAAVFAVAMAICVAAPPTASAQAVAVGAQTRSGYEMVVGVGKSQVIELPSAYTDLMIADPKIADILPLNTHSIYVVGKAPGSTALTVYGPGKQLIAAVNVVVSADLEGFRNRLREILPDEKNVQIRSANQSLLLYGTASSPVALSQVVTLAETYAPAKVVNMMTVEGTQQVMLSVRFVEMNRTTAKALRINIAANASPDPITGVPRFNFNTGDTVIGGAKTASSFGFIEGLFKGADGNLDILFDALETKGLVKTLAEPTLVAMSGDTANFLAGGEFPIPVAQSSASGEGGIPTITVAFKQFGVALAFTPTILKDGLINLVVNPEVSAIDPANSVTSGGIVIPGLSVRRARTTVELRDGESFTIAGLLKQDYANNIRQLPFLGDLPILGSLFRSTSFQRDETELVIVVTPHLVTPRRGGNIALPGDRFVPPSDFELFLFGSQNGSASMLRPEDRALISADPRKGGVEGPHGHVLY
ncbi:MAG: pilus assembly protein CpaC [Phenylobacterium sp.]|jgi:pilus assembly protein CpaC|nr:pilus assembly protein CpaC [Phenylobacterium sp.]MDB5463860.1 pilus assembly protein CpaC [Phenylobacterium sp.]MDB5499308.1 pilus assembly protein CpaC [Phenylobacterium sp.]